jgi:predicted ATP-grasp superfamily ATP-dependent carboligase
MDALVTDAHIHPAVWAIRAFGGAGVTVRALGPERSAPGLWSRHAAGRAVGPDAETHPREFGRAVGALAARHGPLVVYPGREESIDALLEADLPDAAVLPWAPERLAAIRDKRILGRLAGEAGIATPGTVCEAGASELRRLTLDGPCVVKPVRKSAMPVARVVRSSEELRAAIASVPDDEPLIVQRHVEGDLLGLTLVMARDGRPVARVQQRTRRTWPPDAGASSLAVTEPVDEALAGAAVRMLATAEFFGLVQLQFVAGAGPPELIDANPRFYGSLSLALVAGLNLPALWHAVVTGGEVPDAPPSYRSGVSYRHLALDLTAALHGRPGLVMRRAPRPRVGAMWDADDRVAGGLLATRAALAYGRRQAARVRATAGSRLGAGRA